MGLKTAFFRRIIILTWPNVDPLVLTTTVTALYLQWRVSSCGPDIGSGSVISILASRLVEQNRQAEHSKLSFRQALRLEAMKHNKALPLELSHTNCRFFFLYFLGKIMQRVLILPHSHSTGPLLLLWCQFQFVVLVDNFFYTFRNVKPWGQSSRGRLSRTWCSSSRTRFRSGRRSAHFSLTGAFTQPGGNSSSAPPGRNTWQPADVTLKLRVKSSISVYLDNKSPQRREHQRCVLATDGILPVLIKAQVQFWNLCFQSGIW